MAGAVDEMVAVDPDPGLGGRRCRRDQQKDEGEKKRSPQAATFSGARTLRENVNAPSSSDP